MSDHKEILVHILQKVDKVEEHVSRIREDMAEAKADWRYHIKRTDLLEEKVDLLQKAVDVLLWPIKAIHKILRLLKLLK